MSIIRTILVVITMFAPAAAKAASGYVTGRLLFYQNQGAYCPTSRNCTGAMYLQSSFNTDNPVSHVKVYLKQHNTSIVLGQSTTDVDGYYTISWVSNVYPVDADVVWHAEHKDGRFTIQTSTGGKWHLWSAPFTLVNPPTGAPQDLGWLTWGSPGAPNEIANVYDGAWRAWYFALQYSSRMVSNFTGLSIRAFSDTPCASSCANGTENRVYLDTNAAYSPQSRIMHEMGHIAAYKSNPFKTVANFCYPMTSCSSPIWQPESEEWKSGSFNEGLASFIGSVAIYWANAVEPHDCVGASIAPCFNGLFNLETSPYSGGGSCVTNQDRWPLSTERFLWDLYDTAQENFIFTGDFDNRPYSEFFDRLANFPNGTNDHQDDEPWNSARTAVDNFDGRSGEDIAYWYNVNGFNPFNQRTINCNP